MILGHFLGQACMSQFFLDCPVRLLSPRKILDIFKHFHTSNKLLYMVTQLAENGKYCYLTIDIWPQNIDIRPQNIDKWPQDIDKWPQNIDIWAQNMDIWPQNIDIWPQNMDI